MFYQQLLFIENFIQLIRKCNQVILEIYSQDFNVIMKKNNSPLTIADQKVNEIIVSYIKKLSLDLELETNETFTIISEESKNESFEKRKDATFAWLIDPIDGTKEFIKKNGQFTVNIGLAQDKKPVFGIVSIPVTGEIYYGIRGVGSYKIDKESTRLKVNIPKNLMKKNIRIVASLSHQNQETKDFIKTHVAPLLITIGSSIKLLYIAENKADIYPRYAPTSEWDTCAAHAIVKYAGGLVLDVHTRQELQYNKENLLNPYFVVY